jgi:elongation of very long chain fatty acids protein 4
VYHHVSIAWAWWAGMMLFPGGDSYFGAMLNSLVHVLMYSYYAMSLLRIPCSWKKYLTQIQLLQFSSVLVFSVIGMIMIRHKAEWGHYAAHFIQDFEMISFFVLFTQFYKKSYKKRS